MVYNCIIDIVSDLVGRHLSGGNSWCDPSMCWLLAFVKLQYGGFIQKKCLVFQGSRMACELCSQKYRQTPFLVAKFDRKKPICITEIWLKIDC